MPVDQEHTMDEASTQSSHLLTWVLLLLVPHLHWEHFTLL